MQAEAGQPDSAGGLDFLVGIQSEIPPIVRPSTSSAPSVQGGGKPQNINPDMPGVKDWGSYMDVLDSAKQEALADPKGALGGSPNTTTLDMVGIGRGGKWVHKSQAEAPGLCLAITTPKKANLPKSMGA